MTSTTAPPRGDDGGGPEPAPSPPSLGDGSRPAGRGGAVSAGPALLLMAVGLMLVSQAVVDARGSSDGADARDRALYVGGLLLVFVPAALAALLPRIAGSTRVLLALAMMVLLQLARLVVEPTTFAQPAGLVQLAGLRTLERSDQLYGANPLAPGTAYHPGLQVVTDAVGDLTGVGLHLSGVAVLVAARLVVALAVLLVVGGLTRSTRVGAAAVVFYALDPQLSLGRSGFDSPSLALPLAGLAVYLLLSRRRGSVAGVLPAVLATGAVVATDLLTGVVLVVGLLVWAGLDLVLRGGRGAAGAIVVVAGLGAATLLLTDVDADGAGRLLGESTRAGALTLVDRVAGLPSGGWEHTLVVGSLVLTVVALLLAGVRSRGLLRTRDPLVALLVGLGVAFVLVPAGLLLPAVADLGDATTGFTYAGLALLLAWWAWRGPLSDKRAVVLAVGASVVLVGSLLAGAGGLDRQLPGPYRVADGAPSVDPANLAAARWMADRLPRGSAVYADQVGGLLAGAVGGQSVVRGDTTGAAAVASRLLLDPEVTADDVAVVRETGIRYLVADRRLADARPPAGGVYVEPGEVGDDGDGQTRTVTADALRKFSQVPGVDVVYDNGAVVVYDLGGLDDDALG